MIQRLRTSAFLRNNAIFFVGAVSVGILNYAYYPILGRLLDVEAYGEVQALVSLFLQLTIFLTVLSQVTVNVVANYSDDMQKQRVIFELEKVALFLSLAMLVVVAAFGWKLRAFLNFTSVWPFIILMFALVAAVPLTFRSAFLRGHKRFAAVSIANLIGAGTKIILSALFVWIGWSTIGAIFGIVLAQVLAFAYAGYCAYKIGFARPSGAKHTGLPDLRLVQPELKYGLFVLCGSLTVTVLSSVDIFVVKHFFDAETAGKYAGVATVARMIFFLTASIAQVLLPSVRIHQTVRENRSLLIKSFALLTVLGGGAMAIFILFANRIVALFMGNAYDTYAHLLGRLSVAMFVISTLNLIISYYIALRRYKISAIVILGAVVTGCLLATQHQTLDAVVNSLLYGSLSMFAMFVFWRVYEAAQTRMRRQHA